MRKIFIGMVSLAVVVGVFVFYSRIDKTPPIEISSEENLIGDQFDNNDISLNGNIGQFSSSGQEIGVGVQKNLKYIKRNKGEIEQISGFETLLYARGNAWEVEKPYITIFRDGFTCNMLADKGVVEVEKVGSETIFKDAVFSDNVVVSFTPGESRKIPESTMYLDNLTFISEKSQLATNGNVKFDSQNLQLTGTGMELVYNEEQRRFEFFKIIDLNNLNIKLRQSTLRSMNQISNPSDVDASQNQEPQLPVSTTVDSQTSEQNQDDYYTCIFSKNVLIDTPNEIISAALEIQIDDIMWSKNSDIADDNDSAELLNLNDLNEPNPLTAIAEPDKSDETPDELVDVSITCDDGFVVIPKSSKRINEYKSKTDIFTDVEIQQLQEPPQKTTLITQKVYLDLPQSNSVAAGPTQLTFYVEDLNSSDPNWQKFPVIISSKDGAEYTKETDLVLFRGDCSCKIPQRNLSSQEYAVLSAPVFIIDLPDSNSAKEQIVPDITAEGPAELDFFMVDSNSATNEQKLIPVKITAQEKAQFLTATNQVVFDGDCYFQIGSTEIAKEQFISLSSKKLTIDLPQNESGKSSEIFDITSSGDITATGPIDLNFYMQDPNNKGTPKSFLPVNITAKDQAKFLSSSQKIVVTGSCKSTMLREETDFVQELKLLAETITVELPNDVNNETSASSLTQIRHMKAGDEKVTLKITKKAKSDMFRNQTPGQILGETKLICNSLNYDTQEQIFTASGPGELTLSDTQIKEPNDPNEYAVLGKKWRAEAYGFSDLTYLLNKNQIIANSEPTKTLNVQYIEWEDEKYSPVIMATAGHLEIQLAETENKKLEPSIVVASGGIDYKKDDDNRFLGSVLLYEHDKSLITIKGDQNYPCVHNSFIYDEIVIDLTKDDDIESIKLKSRSPGSF